MKTAVSQPKAKLMIRDYLRETGRKGVASLMRDINRHAKTKIFAQRTLEKWLKESDRVLQDNNWEIVLSFIDSTHFKSCVAYAREGSSEKRLRQVAEGFVALYTTAKQPTGLYIMPSTIREQGAEAFKQLGGHWERVPSKLVGDDRRIICKVSPVDGERYAKIAYIGLFHSKQVSATGLAIYLNSDKREGSVYCHNFFLQLWRRRDPESDSKMPAGLYHLHMSFDQPEFVVSKVINQYFYKEPDPEGARGDIQFALERDLEPVRYHTPNWLPNNDPNFSWAKDAIILRKSKSLFEEEMMMIDTLIEDVLPHGYTKA